MARRVEFGLLFALALSLGCAAANRKVTATDGPMHAPPQEARAVTMPTGPPVVQDAIRARQLSTDGAGVQSAGNEVEGILSRQMLQEFLERGPSYTLTVVEVDPARKESSFVGFEVTAIAASARGFLGPWIQVGDVVTHVNGIKLESPDDYLQVWRSLQDVEAVRIDLLRSSETHVVTWLVE